MDKQKLKTICDDLANKIASDPSTEEEFMKNIKKYSADDKTISSAGMMQCCMDASQEFTKKLIYSVLCETLDL